MKKNAMIGLCVIILAGTLASAASAQFTITIPKLPKIKKTQQTTTTTTTEESRQQTDSTRRDEPDTTTAKSGSCTDDAVLRIHMEGLEETRKQAAEYTPGLRDYYVRDFSDRENIYLKASLNSERRREWLRNWPEHMVKCIEPALDELAATAKKTLPTYVPTGYNIRNPAEERVLRSGVNDLAEATVFKVGLLSAAWKISKDNFNFPTSRYKHGMIWARYPKQADGFCRIVYVNIVQDYAGGGTYAESRGNLIKSEYAGCPPGK